MNKVLYFNQEPNMYRKTATIYKDIIRALKNNGYHTRYLVEMNYKDFNGVEVFMGARAFSRDRLKELVDVRTSKIEVTIDDNGYLSLITYVGCEENELLYHYIGLWSIQPMEKKKA